MLEGLHKVSEQRPKIRGAWICGKLTGGAWCCSWPNCWIQGTSKKEIFVGIHGILINVISGLWNFFRAIKVLFTTTTAVELSVCIGLGGLCQLISIIVWRIDTSSFSVTNIGLSSDLSSEDVIFYYDLGDG